MKHAFTGPLCAAVVLASGIAVFAQTTPPPATSTQPQTPAVTQETPATGSSITVAGCVQRERDYRRAHNRGKGGAVGTGVGADNEYVLVQAGLVPAGTTTTTPPPATTTGTAGTAAVAPAGTDAYELTGPNESQLSQFVDRRVEIVGRVKSTQPGSGISVKGGVAGGTSGTGTVTGTATGSVRTGGGVDVLGQDLNLKELEISSVREVPGGCAPMAK